MGWRSKITTTEINFSSQARDFKAEGSIFQAFQIKIFLNLLNEIPWFASECNEKTSRDKSETLKSKLARLLDNSDEFA
jgi:hypothetical protein